MCALRRCSLLIIFFALLQPIAVQADMRSAKARASIEIPAIALSVPIVLAPYAPKINSWDMTGINTKAAFLEGLPQPGQGGNAVVAAHSELARRTPGPFVRLNELKLGDRIFIEINGNKYSYSVTQVWSVVPSDLSPIAALPSESLTLITCAAYNDLSGMYLKRLIVRAALNG